MKRIVLNLLLNPDFKKKTFVFELSAMTFFHLQNKTHITVNKVSNSGQFALFM